MIVLEVDPLVQLMKVEKTPDSTYEMIGGVDKQIKEPLWKGEHMTGKHFLLLVVESQSKQNQPKSPWNSRSRTKTVSNITTLLQLNGGITSVISYEAVDLMTSGDQGSHRASHQTSRDLWIFGHLSAQGDKTPAVDHTTDSWHMISLWTNFVWEALEKNLQLNMLDI